METSKNFEANPEARLHFLDYWRIIRVRKTVILAVFLLVAITTTAVTFILPPTFASITRILVQKDAPDIAGIGGGQSYNMFDPYWVQTEFEKIQSKLILYQVISNLNLNVTWGEKYKEGALRPDLTYKLLKRAIDVNQSRNTSLIEIKAFSDDPNEAAAIANMIAEVYRKSRRDKWDDMSRGGLQAIEVEMTNQMVQIKTLQKEV